LLQPLVHFVLPNELAAVGLRNAFPHSGAAGSKFMKAGILMLQRERKVRQGNAARVRFG